MTDLTPEQEAARRPNGEFGSHDNTGPEVHLADGNGFRDPSYPLIVEVALERWNVRDEAEEVGFVEFDARALFDSRSLAQLGGSFNGGDADWIYSEASSAGLVDGHSGPFTVRLPEEFDDYVEHRENNGMNDAYPNAEEILSAQITDAKMHKRAESLENASRLLAEAGEKATYAKKASELAPGDVLVQGQYRVAVISSLDSSDFTDRIRGGGSSQYAVGTEFGTLLLDEDDEVTVEAF